MTELTETSNATIFTAHCATGEVVYFDHMIGQE